MDLYLQLRRNTNHVCFLPFTVRTQLKGNCCFFPYLKDVKAAAASTNSWYGVAAAATRRSKSSSQIKMGKPTSVKGRVHYEPKHSWAVASFKKPTVGHFRKCVYSLSGRVNGCCPAKLCEGSNVELWGFQSSYCTLTLWFYLASLDAKRKQSMIIGFIWRCRSTKVVCYRNSPETESRSCFWWIMPGTLLKTENV